MSLLRRMSAETIALYERDGFVQFGCMVCGEQGFIETPYEEMGVCASCVKNLAHAYIMKHSGTPDPTFAPKEEYASWLAEKERKRREGKQPIPSRIRRQVLERDKYRCQECGDHRDLQVDHIHPESKGGTLDLGNLQCLCKPCNTKKGKRI